MDTNNKLALQILYWLEDRGLSVDYSNWGETAYYRFMDPQDFQNAIYLLRMYCGEKSLLGIDRNRLEIRIDLTFAWTKLKESLDEDKEELLNSSLDKNEDTITEELMESDSVEDDLNEIIEDCLVDFQEIGKPLCEPSNLLALDEQDWKENEEKQTFFTEERFLPKILVELGIYPSISEIRRNRPDLVVTLDTVDFINKLKIKKKQFKLVI